MGNEVIKDSRDSYSKVVSVLFHPLFMPVYGLAIILSANSPFGFLPFNVKRLMFLIFIVNNVFLPISLLPFLMQMNFISSWTLEEREERAVPMIVTTILYATTSYIVYRFPVPHFLKTFIFATFLLSFIVTIVNFRWKISLHSVGIGALIATILYLAFNMHAPLGWYLIGAIIAAGMVLSARLRLNLHNPPQVWSGFFTGFAGMTLLIMFLQQLT